MKKKIGVIICVFLSAILSAQFPEKHPLQMIEKDKQKCEQEENFYLLCRDSYWTWNCRTCGATNVQEANCCMYCGTAR